MAVKELELKVPTSYADITLKQWIELQNELERLMAEFSTVVDVTAEEVEEPIAIKA